MYCAENAGSAYPKDTKQRATINAWLLWEASAWFPSCYAYLVEFVVKPLLGAQPDQAVIDEKAPRFNQLATILDIQLGKTKWLTGDSVTIADLAVASPMHLWAAQRLPLDKYPNLKRWYTQEVAKLPSWIASQGAVDKALLPAAPTNGTGSSPAAVKAPFHYTKETPEKPTELYFYDHPAAATAHEPGDDVHEMAVKDAWPRAHELSVDKHGFSVHDFQTGFAEWDDGDAVTERFYPEVVEFLKKTVGAKRVLVFDHTIRTKANQDKKLTQEANTSQRAPVALVHCDYTRESGPTRLRQLLPEEAEGLLGKRVAFFNVWKPIRQDVLEKPLAMCDVDSTTPDDFFKLHLRYRERNGENYVMRHSKAHQWYYFPKMTPSNVILLKVFDNMTDGRAQFVGHSAFDDPTSPPDAPTRESVEIRTIAFF